MKEATRNEQMVAPRTLGELRIYHRIAPNIEKIKSEVGCGSERERCFSIDGDKKARDA